jgi:hypothetical protein
VFRNYVTQPFNRKNLSTLRGYCMIQITWKLVRKVVLVISRSSINMGHL